MGRKKLPTNLKVIKGTAQKCRINPNEPKPNPEIPAAPNHLSKEALIEWGRISGQLYRLGLLANIDMAALAAYCQAYGRWVEAELAIKKNGLTIETSNLNVIQNPEVGIANKAMELMHKYLTEFGMTPASRARVSAKPKEGEKKSPWEALG